MCEELCRGQLVIIDIQEKTGQFLDDDDDDDDVLQRCYVFYYRPQITLIVKGSCFTSVL